MKDFLFGKRVVVTAGIGFLGSNLCERLLDAGNDVICHDITFPISLEVDEIYNLACPASTSEVYGYPAVHPQPESCRGNVNPVGPRSCYDEGKRCAAPLFFGYYRRHKLGIKVARIFKACGPGMLPDDCRVVSNFIMQALRGEDITIYGEAGIKNTVDYFLN